jgi:hypothetical protein
VGVKKGSEVVGCEGSECDEREGKERERERELGATNEGARKKIGSASGGIRESDRTRV